MTNSIRFRSSLCIPSDLLYSKISLPQTRYDKIKILKKDKNSLHSVRAFASSRAAGPPHVRQILRSAR